MRDVRTIGHPFNADIVMYDGCKYERSSGKETRKEYKDIDYWEIVDREDAKEIEDGSDGSMIDEYHEYLVLHFVDGSTATFRNSHVDMFRI